METLILARHGHAAANAADIVSGAPPGEGLTRAGVEQACALQAALAGEQIDLGACTAFLRTQQTLALALGDRTVPTLVVPELNEIRFGSFDGGPLAAYRRWAWESGPDVACPGGGESRAQAARRFAAGLRALLERPEPVILAIGHALPLRYVLDAAGGRLPAARIERVEHAAPLPLTRDAVEVAAETLAAWARRPCFADTPFGG